MLVHNPVTLGIRSWVALDRKVCNIRTFVGGGRMTIVFWGPRLSSLYGGWRVGVKAGGRREADADHVGQLGPNRPCRLLGLR